jgi:PhzF family phenazine biosynthesis protein
MHVRAPDAAFEGEFRPLTAALSQALGGPVVAAPPPAAFRNGPNWLFAQLPDEEAVASLQPDLSAIAALSREHGITGVAVFAFAGGEFAVHVRCFAPAFGVPEDPVTGSANAALPAYLARYSLLDRTGREYVATQGTELGRDGRVYVSVLDDEGRAEIGGNACTVVEGEIAV